MRFITLANKMLGKAAISASAREGIKEKLQSLKASILNSTPVTGIIYPTVINIGFTDGEPWLVLEWVFKGDRVSLFIDANGSNTCLVRWVDSRICTKDFIYNGLKLVQALIDLYSHKEYT